MQLATDDLNEQTKLKERRRKTGKDSRERGSLCLSRGAALAIVELYVVDAVAGPDSGLRGSEMVEGCRDPHTGSARHTVSF